MRERKILILLTRYPDVGSRLIEIFTGTYFTHASIGLDEDVNTFYSFNYKGFAVEKVERFARLKGKGYPCQLYELPVDEKTYRAMKQVLHGFVEHKNRFRYTRFGVAMCLLRIPYRRNGRFFCSQFVAEVLHRAQVVRLKKASTLYLPCDFRSLPGIQLHLYGDLRDLKSHFGKVYASAA
ncbi:MAG: hypothetical protein IJ452_06655 [Butyricicoccus sp.]|nr:hypothetical protein [Butyricicoccus sp.]MBQ8585944.1 hypothetical protein [Butyricicoccus sp.]